jgi:hypothetical protein
MENQSDLDKLKQEGSELDFLKRPSSSINNETQKLKNKNSNKNQQVEKVYFGVSFNL